MVFFSLLPFYLHSPTSLSVKIQSFLTLSALCAYILHPGIKCALYQLTMASVYDQSIRLPLRPLLFSTFLNTFSESFAFIA